MDDTREPNTEPTQNTGSSQEKEGRWTRLDLPLSALHLFTLCSLALAKPLYDVTAKDAAFYVVRGSKPIDILSLILILSVLIPAGLALIEWLLGLVNRRLRLFVHFPFIYILIALYGAQFVKQFKGLDGFLSSSMILATGACGALLYARTQSFRRLISMASPVIILFPLLFVFGSQVGQIIKPGGFVWSNDEGKTKHVYLKKKPPIVFVVLDELPVVSLLDEKGNIDSKRFPSLAEFANNASWFRNATTVADGTVTAVPAILTGIQPIKKKLPNLTDCPDNIFTLLQGNYSFNVFESETHLCPTGISTYIEEPPSFSERLISLFKDIKIIYLHIIAPGEFTKHIPSISNKWGNFTNVDPGSNKKYKVSPQAVSNTNELGSHEGGRLNADRAALFHKFIAQIDGKKKESLNYIHIELPHVPYVYLPSGKQYLSTIVIDNNDVPQEVLTHAQNKHLLQLGYVDKLFGELIHRLRSTGLYNESLIILTADHGVNFISGNQRRSITEENAADIAFVPLLLKLPGQIKGEDSSLEAETIDIVPTIAEVLGIKLPWKYDGISLLSKDRPQKKEKTVFRDDKLISFDKNMLYKGRTQSLSRNVKLFSLDDPASNFYWFGAHRKILGKKVTEFKTGESSLRINVSQASFFQNVDLNANFLPAGISGQIVGSIKNNNKPLIAVSVNGIIHAVTESFVFNNELSFYTFIPESALKQGNNDMEVFILSEDSGKYTLLSAKLRPLDYNLKTGKIIASNDRIFNITSNGIQGTVDNIYKNDKTVTINGWASDINTSKEVDSVLVFSNDKFVFAGETNSVRIDVFKQFHKESVKKSGFSFSLPTNSIVDLRKLRVFAISNETATELEYDKSTGLTSDYLKKIDFSGISYHFSNGAIVSDKGDTFAFNAQKFQGSVDVIKKKTSNFMLSGWAVNVEKSVPVDSILIFDRERFVASGITRLSRPDLRKLTKIGSLGFDYLLPAIKVKRLEDLRIFAISNGYATELNILRHSRLNGPRYTLGKVELLSEKGNKFPLFANALHGSIEVFEIKSKKISIAGWAANTKKSQPVDSIVIFSGDTFVGSGKTNIYRLDVSNAYHDDNVAMSGFNFTVQIKEIKDPAQVRIFAVSQGIATELSPPRARQAENSSMNDLPAENLYALQGNNLISPDGKQIPLVSQNVQGSLDTLARNANGVVLSGWSADVARKQPVELMLIFHDGKLVAAKAPNVARPDVSKVFNADAMEYCGFEYLLPTRAVSSMKKIRLFAVSEDAGAEIKYFGKLQEEDSPPKPEVKPPVLSNQSTALPKAGQE